jgi:hypothetical protein
MRSIMRVFHSFSQAFCGDQKEKGPNAFLYYWIVLLGVLTHVRPMGLEVYMYIQAQAYMVSTCVPLLGSKMQVIH